MEWTPDESETTKEKTQWAEPERKRGKKMKRGGSDPAQTRIIIINYQSSETQLGFLTRGWSFPQNENETRRESTVHRQTSIIKFKWRGGKKGNILDFFSIPPLSKVDSILEKLFPSWVVGVKLESSVIGSREKTRLFPVRVWKCQEFREYYHSWECICAWVLFHRKSETGLNFAFGVYSV